MTDNAEIKSCQQSCFDSATALASAGKYESALTMLESVTLPELALPVSLLRAKVYAQLSDHEKARHEWDNALAIDPENKEALRGIRLSKRLCQAGRSRFLLQARLYYGILLAIITILVIALVYPTRDTPADDPANQREEWLALRRKELQTRHDFIEAMQTGFVTLDSNRDINSANKKILEKLQEISQKNNSLAQQLRSLGNQAERQEHMVNKIEELATLIQETTIATEKTEKTLTNKLADIETTLKIQQSEINRLAEQQTDLHNLTEKQLRKQSEQQIESLQVVAEAQAQAINKTNQKLAENRTYMSTQFEKLETEFSEKTAGLEEAHTYVLNLLSPKGLKIYPARIDELQDRIENLQEKMPPADSRSIPLVTSLTRSIRNARLKSAKEKLQENEEAFKDEVIPWLSAIEAVDASHSVNSDNLTTEEKR